MMPRSQCTGRPRTSMTWSMRSVCWPVRATRTSTVDACASSARTTGASLMPSGRVPTTTRTLGRSAIRLLASANGEDAEFARSYPSGAGAVREAPSPALPPLASAPGVRLRMLLRHQLREEAKAEQEHADDLEQD